MADEDEGIPDEVEDQDTWVLLRDLPLHTSRRRLINKFRAFDVDNIEFLNRADMITYTRCCKIQMQSQDDVDSILGNTYYDFNKVMVKAERFRGAEHHKDVFEKGKFKIIIRNVKVEDDKKVYKMMEAIFQEFLFTDLLLRKDRDGNFTGIVDVRFRTEDGREQAKQLVKDMKLQWMLVDAKKRQR